MKLFVCSGTGGHVYPAIACAQYLESEDVHFLVDKGRVAETILKKYPFNTTALALSRDNKWTWITQLPQIRRCFKEKHISQVLSFGGYVSIPVVMLAWCMRIPVTLCEQNAWPGKANRLLQYFATKICLSFPDTGPWFNPKKTMITGNPVRTIFAKDDIIPRLETLKFSQGKKILILGGSQGASFLNQFFITHTALFKEQSWVGIHLLGDRDFKQQFPNQTRLETVVDNETIHMARINYCEQMDALYHWADIVISRAGATSVAELLNFQKPAILIPFPHATDNHQYHNAKAVVDTGQAQIIDQPSLSPDSLKTAINNLEKIPPQTPHQVNMTAILSN